MVLIKEIELELSKKKDNVPEAIEDTLIKDSVLDLANTDFSKIDEFEDVTAGDIRKKIIVDTGYIGKPISRKKFSTNTFEGDTNVRKEISDIEQDKTLSEDNSDIVSQASSIEIKKSDRDTDDELENESDAYSEDAESESDDEDEEDEFGDDINLADYQEASDVQKEEINLFSAKTKDTNAEIAKGTSVKNQLNIWESLLEARIKFQPTLIAANKLYQKDDLINFKSQLKPEDETVISNAYSSLGNLMKVLLELQDVLLNSSPEYLKQIETKNADESKQDNDAESISSSTASGKEEEEEEREKNDDENDEEEVDESEKESAQTEPIAKKPKVDGSNRTDHIEELYADFRPFKDATIQTWNDKTKISSGKVNNSGGYSAYDLPTLKQIEQILLDKKRLIRKTQLKRSDYKILGKQHKTDDADDKTEEELGRDNERIQKEYDAEIFDDDDFYHKLLRDFIERKSTDGTDTNKFGRQWLEIQQLRSKMKRKVDTRCTKGRKLRYTVHNKLVNFMAPIPCNEWSDEAQTQLFKSLFGKAAEQI